MQPFSFASLPDLLAEFEDELVLPTLVWPEVAVPVCMSSVLVLPVALGSVVEDGVCGVVFMSCPGLVAVVCAVARAPVSSRLPVKRNSFFICFFSFG
jgi:hypothetical protein